MPDFPLQALLHIIISSKQTLLLFRQTADGLLSSRLSIHCSCQFYTATHPEDWFCSVCYAEIPVAVIKSEIRVADFCRVAPLSYKFDEV